MNPNDWQKLLTELGAKKNNIDDIFQALLKSYSEPHRTWVHSQSVDNLYKSLKSHCHSGELP
ncbi:MAG: hypothetical protein GY749_44980 [Desulfobacteraceae bacterium]|nr:hypothetical protein [Desulfobacteraceae bacterium]